MKKNPFSFNVKIFCTYLEDLTAHVNQEHFTVEVDRSASIDWVFLCPSAAEEDAGDAEQDAAADARERPVRAELVPQRHLLSPLWTTVRPSDDKLGYRVSGDSGCTFILGLVLCIVCPPGGSSEESFFWLFFFFNSPFAYFEPLAVV